MANDWNQVSSIFLGVITASATVALAYYANKSFKGVKDQMDLMFKQSVDMKRQAEAMEKQSAIMLENMEYDRLTKKYDRVNREMNLLIGQLFARRNDDQLFILHKQSKRIKLERGHLNELNYDFVSFWESIDQNLYLNRSRDFKTSYDNYKVVIDSFFSDQPEQEKEKLKEIFKKGKSDFIRNIETRYHEITDELNEIESELKILDEKKKMK